MGTEKEVKGPRQAKAEGSGPAQCRRAGKGLTSNNSVQRGSQVCEG